jgi:signal transduction histidine kinase/ligand-binding sensor domain-containing protein
MLSLLRSVPLEFLVGWCRFASCAALLFSTAGFARCDIVAPHRVFGKYTQYTWKVEQGLPQNTVAAIAKTRSGYIWLGTVEGLVRFDGVRFTVFNSSNTPAIRSNLITALLEDRNGTLWIGTDGGGLAYLRNGNFGVYGKNRGLSDEHVTCLLEDEQGTLWIGTDGGGLDRFQDGRFEIVSRPDGLPDDHVWALEEDGSGGLWIGTAGGLAHRGKQNPQVWTSKDGLPGNFIRSLVRDDAGQLWIATERGLCIRRQQRFEERQIPGGAEHPLVWVLAKERDGSIWAGSNTGITRYRDGIAQSYTARDGLPQTLVRSIHADADGSIWIGMHDRGLCRLVVSRFSVYTGSDGLAGTEVSSIRGDSVGNLWIASATGLSRIHDGRVTIYPGPAVCTVGAHSIGEDFTKTVWLSGDALCRLEHGRFQPLLSKGAPSGRLYSVVGGSDGGLWIGGYDAGLNQFKNGRFRHYTAGDGFAGGQVISLFLDRAGDLWIATRSQGVSRLHQGHFTTWTRKDGLGSDHPLCFYQDRAGSLWIGTHGGGLSRFRDGKLATITSRDGLYDDLAFAILEDDSGNLWMSGNKGVYRASLRDLNAFADGRIGSVDSSAYGVEDGMLNRECNGGSPAAWKTPDGRLWFATEDGAAVLNPRNQNREPPLVNIEGVMVQHRRLVSGSPIRIMPGQDELEIEYTALAWQRAPEVRFRYRLAGLEQGWVDAGTRRTAYYSHLPAGDYTFQVIADNGEGVWNMQGQSLAISVLPRYYQTLWFKVLLTALGASLVATAWQFRVAQFKKTQALVERFSRQLMASQEGERKRIAVELHDGLGQHLAVIKSLALVAADSPTNGCAEQLEIITEQASQAIGEVRGISHNLRPIQLDRLGLTKAVRTMASRAFAGTNIEVTIQLDSLDYAFEKDVEIHFYRIVQECVNNILKHSDATRINVIATRNDKAIHLTISDNGKGFLESASQTGGTAGLGLTGIRERARLLNGVPAIRSMPGGGTTVTIQFVLGHPRL